MAGKRLQWQQHGFPHVTICGPFAGKRWVVATSVGVTMVLLAWLKNVPPSFPYPVRPNPHPPFQIVYNSLS